MKRATSLLLALALLLAAASGVCAGGTTLKKAPVDRDGAFYNPWADAGQRSFTDFLRWRLSRNPWAAEKRKNRAAFTVQRPDFAALERVEGDWFVWLGHSTVLMRVGGSVIITDPVFWDVNFLVRRAAPLPADPDELPAIDFVLISHGHYDHLDTRTIEFLRDRHDPFFITGPGYEAYFSSLRITRRAPLDWTEEYSEGGLRITSLPAQHWSKRVFAGDNRMLWCSFLVEHAGRSYYWTGDSGYFAGFSEIGQRWGPIDIVFAPIGAYEPRWFMKENHMDPAEALQAASDLKARVFVPIHWGTFDLSDEPLGQPIDRLRQLRPVEPLKVRVLEHGGALVP